MRSFALMLASVLTAAVSAVDDGAGSRVSRATTSLSYVAVGDSITHTGVTAPTGWPNLYAADLGANLKTTTSVTDLGVNGATSGEVLALVAGDPSTRASIAGAELVTYQAGINDFLAARGSYINGTCGGADNEDCLRSTVASFAANWDGLVDGIHGLAPLAARRTMTIYYPTAGYDQSIGAFGVLNSYLSQMNAHIVSTPGGPLADVHGAFNGPSGTDDPYASGYLLTDDVHLTSLGHNIVFFRLRGLGYEGISSATLGVGGVAQEPDVLTSRPGQSRRSYATVGAVLVVVVVVLGAGSWYVHRARAA